MPRHARVHSRPLALRPPVADEHLEQWRDLRLRALELSTPSGAFYLLVVLSTTIAAFGLLANSTAVVIGAMLVAPLMGPIFGIAFGLTTGDTDLLGHAVAAEAKGMALAVALAVGIGFVPNRPDFGTEILARTSPTVYDAVVALASGLAGAFALADRRVSPALPGVAIATAIVPPLATVGLCVAAGRLDQAGGAFLLFFTNLLAIELAAVAIFTWVGHRQGHLHGQFRMGYFVRHFGVSLVLLAAIGVFLTRTLVEQIGDNRRRAAVRALLEEQTRSTQGARVDQLAFEQEGDSLRVFASVLTPQEFGPAEVAAAEDRLRAAIDPRLRLVMRSVLARDYDRRGAVFVAAADREQAEVDRQTALLALARRTLRAQLDSLPGVELEELRRAVVVVPPPPPVDSFLGNVAARGAPAAAPADSVIVFTALVRAPVPVAPARVDTLERALVTALGRPARLVVRTMLARDADARGFLYEPADSATATPAAAGTRPATRLTGGRR